MNIQKKEKKPTPKYIDFPIYYANMIFGLFTINSGKAVRVRLIDKGRFMIVTFLNIVIQTSNMPRKS